MRGAWARGLALTTAGLLLACSPTPSASPSPRASPSEPAPPVTLPGRVLHVEPRGEENGSGSKEDPFGSLQTALSALRPGDTLLLGGGTYRERVVVRPRPGRREAPVILRPAQGAVPVLRGLLWLDHPSWWRIEGLDVVWDPRNDSDEHMVKIDGGDDWVLSDAELSGARSYAAVLVSGKPSRFTLRRLFVHDTARANGINQDHLLYLNSGTGGGTVEGCLLVGSPNGRAIKVGPDDASGAPVGRIAIRYNTMVDNRGPSNVQLAWRSSGVTLDHNIMQGSLRGRENVTAFRLRGKGNVVRNNIGWQSAGVLQDAAALEDGRDNRVLDPRLRTVDGRPYVATAPEAAGLGYTALPPVPHESAAGAHD